MRFLPFLLIVLLFIVINIFLAATIYRSIHIVPSYSISMSKYQYPEFDPKRSLILPGSLVILIDNSATIFNLYNDRPIPDLYGFLSNILLALSIASLTGAILLLTREGYMHASIILLLISSILFGLSVYFRAPVYPKDIACYKITLEGEVSLVCHQYLNVTDNTAYLRRVYDNATENITVDNIIAKVVYVVPPPTGTLLVMYRAAVDFIYTLYVLITQGHIPLGYKIEYIAVG